MIQFAWKRPSCAFPWIQNSLRLAAMVLFVASACWAQLPQAGDTTSPPTPGVGHDYIHAPVETVNPANGSVSIRIPVRIPEGRELTIPLDIAYDSSGAFYYGMGPGITEPSYATTSGVPFSQGGWSYTFPLLTFSLTSWTVLDTDSGKNLTCTGRVNYVFQDPTGNRNDMNLAANTSIPSYSAYCGSDTSQTGGEGPILAVTGGGGEPTATITDGNGTVYSFAGGLGANLPTSITDRNGNTISVTSGSSSASVEDTAGRTAVSVSSFGGSPDDIDVAGLSSPYAVSWTTASASFTITVDNLNPGISNNCPTSLSNSAKAISQIVLPNGQKYSFSYDPTYGMLDKITYPTGGYVSYTWGINSQAEAGIWTGQATGQTVSWDCRYDFPAITDRYVSFDGTTEALHQHFTYSTTWPSGSADYTSKTTTVTTYDLIRNTSFETIYTYTAFSSPCQPNFDAAGCANGKFTQEMPYEETIQYYGTNGSLLQTVAKGWYNGGSYGTAQPTLSSVQTTPAGSGSSLTMYCYNTSQEVTEENEYDFGSSTPSLPSCASGVPSGTTAGPLLRETLTSYATFTTAHIVDLPSSVITYNGSGTRVAETDSSYDQSALESESLVQLNAAPGGTARGNLTTVTKQCFQGSTSCSQGNSTTTYLYDNTGQPYQMTDPNGNITKFSYTDSYSSCSGGAPPDGATNAYLTQVTYPPTNGVSHIESYCYGYPAGLLKGSTDENNETTLYDYVDSLDRLTEAAYPDGGETLVSYNDTPPTPSVTVEKEITSGQYVTNVSITDGVGLPIETELTSDPSGTDVTLTSYDGLGRKYTVTNAYRSTSDPTYGITEYVYDSLGRTCVVIPPGGTSQGTCPTAAVAGDITMVYSGSAMEVSDEGNGTESAQRISQTDGLGRMTSVCEVSSATQQGSSGTPAACGQEIAATGFLVTYSYDALDDLLSVSQSSLGARTFAYDSLAQLISASNPESGLTTYTYDPTGNVTSRTQPEENQTDASDTVTTTYVYDALNRMTAKEYSDDTDNVDYNYDETSPWGFTLTNPTGRLTTEYDGNTGSVFSYDPMGRVVQNHQCTPQNCGSADFPIAYTYDLTGDILTSTDGEVNTYTRTYNDAEELTQLTSSYSDSNHPGTLFSMGSYNAPSQLTSAHLGNGITETRGYNARLEMTSLAAGSVYSLSMSSYAPDGNILGVSDSANGTWTYAYDAFNRLISSSCSSLCPDGESTQGFSYSYDRFGNRWTQTVTAGSGGTFSLTFTGNNNHIDGYAYDAAGNLLSDGSHTYYYDAEHHLVQVDGSEGYCQSGTGTAPTACYTYDAEGRRVRRTVPGSGITDDYLYDLSGHYITQVSGTGFWIRGELYAGNRHLGTYENDLSTPTTFFNHSDWLGTERVQTVVGGTACETIVSLPFGDGLTTSGSCDPSAEYFTGKERDWETNLDNFGARYNSSQFGRFMSPDSLGGNLIDPQTLNKYSYVRNNPVTLTDPTGMYTCSDDKNQCKTKQDINFEKARQQDLKSKDADVVRAAKAYGDPTKDNGVNVGFADLSKKNEGGDTTSTLGTDANQNLRANSNVVIDSNTANAGGSALDAVVGHEGSHVADAQDLVNSIMVTDLTKGTFTVGQDITQYASEQRAYHVTDSILRSDDTHETFECGVATCQLGNTILRAQVTNIVDQILRSNYRSAINNQPLTEKNPGASVVPH